LKRFRVFRAPLHAINYSRIILTNLAAIKWFNQLTSLMVLMDKTTTIAMVD
jgi:hypothetical protein